MEFLELTTHSGTHLDAPWHYHPTMDGGKRALTIDEIPLEWCIGKGVVLDFRHFPDGYRVSVKDVEKSFRSGPYFQADNPGIIGNLQILWQIAKNRLTG